MPDDDTIRDDLTFVVAAAIEAGWDLFRILAAVLADLKGASL